MHSPPLTATPARMPAALAQPNYEAPARSHRCTHSTSPLATTARMLAALAQTLWETRSLASPFIVSPPLPATTARMPAAVVQHNCIAPARSHALTHHRVIRSADARCSCPAHLRTRARSHRRSCTHHHFPQPQRGCPRPLLRPSMKRSRARMHSHTIASRDHTVDVRGPCSGHL
jgi:hypothetical protein